MHMSEKTKFVNYLLKKRFSSRSMLISKAVLFKQSGLLQLVLL